MTENERIAPLHGLRAISAFWVMTAHCFIWTGLNGHWVPNPKIAVDLFMMMSGLLMVHSVREHASDGGSTVHRWWARFYIRRFFRIAPAYYLALLIVAFSPWFRDGYIVLFHISQHGSVSAKYDPSHTHFGLWEILTHVTFVFGLMRDQVNASLLPDWSLSLEMQFYLIFPLLYVACRKFGWLPTLVAISLLCIGVTYALHGHWLSDPSVLFQKLQYFAIGMLTYQAMFRTDSALERAAIFAICLGFALSDFRYYHSQTIIEVLCFAAFWIVQARGARDFPVTRSIIKALSSRVAVFGSEASYSVYLFHGFFLSACGLLLFKSPLFLSLPAYEKTGIVWGIVFVASYLTATLIYRFIEEPGIALGSSVSKHRLIAKRPRAVSSTGPSL